MSNMPYRPWSEEGYEIAPQPRVRVVREFRLRDHIIGALVMAFIGIWALGAMEDAAHVVLKAMQGDPHTHLTANEIWRAAAWLVLDPLIAVGCFWLAWRTLRIGFRISRMPVDTYYIKRRY